MKGRAQEMRLESVLQGGVSVFSLRNILFVLEPKLCGVILHRRITLPHCSAQCVGDTNFWIVDNTCHD